MRRIIIPILCGLAIVSCAKVETATNENIQANTNETVSASLSPTVAPDIPLLKPVTIKVELEAEQKKNLNESLPLQVREILEKAERFEVLAEVENEPDGLRFEPNRIVKISREDDKKEILENFYHDASGGLLPSACYIPHHAVRAEYKGKTVEIEICFQCHLFFVKSSFGKFEGGFAEGSQKSETVFNRVIHSQSVEIK